MAFLVLAALGAVVSVSTAVKRREWYFAVPLSAAAAMLVLGMSSRIAFGLRHLLAIYPMLAILAGVGAGFLWHVRVGQRFGRTVVVLLVMWLVIGVGARASGLSRRLQRDRLVPHPSIFFW